MEPSNWAPAHTDALRKYFAMACRMRRSRGRSMRNSRRIIPAVPRSAAPGGSTLALPGCWTDWPRRHRKPPRRTSTKWSRTRKLWPSGWRGSPIARKCRSCVAPRSSRAACRCSNSKPATCRYPYGGDEEGEAITFCGHPKRRGSSYCAAHFHLTRNPDAAPQRAVVTAAMRVVETPSTSRFRRYSVSQFQGND